MSQILVIEDNDSVRQNVADFLELSGHSVSQAASGDKGLDMIRTGKPNLVICDIQIPELDGYDVLKAVRSEREISQTPFIFLTARTEREDFRKGMNLGANDYITKPFKMDELLDAVNARLKHSVVLDAVGNRDQGNWPSEDNVPRAILLVHVDRLGHLDSFLRGSTGEALNKSLLTLIQETTPRGTTIESVDRHNYLVVFPEMQSIDQLEMQAREFLKILRKPIRFQGRLLNLAIYAGLSFYPRDGITHMDLFRRAEIAQFHSLEKGNDLVVFEENMLQIAREVLDIESDLVTALESGGLELYFQPIWNSSNITIASYEALIRWNHPEYGMIPPARFIPVAESTGLIKDVGKWTLTNACRIAAQNNFIVSVNISPVEFTEVDLVERVERTLKETGLPPARLDLEITEGCLLHHESDTMKNFSRLKKLGLSVSIDDFGTGYSSLAYLKTLPADRIKIDRAFISDVDQDKSGERIIQAIVQLAGGLGLEVVAEGVENERQLELIRGLGCQFIQGFFLGKPANVVNAMTEGFFPGSTYKLPAAVV